MTFTAKCRKVGFTENQIETVRRYRTKHKELADEEVIARYKLNGFVKNKRIGLRQEARQAGFSETEIDKMRRFASMHKELTNEEIINHYLNIRMSFREKCRQVGISEKNFNAIHVYRRKHKELTDEQVIAHYKPELRLNIFGNIILPNGETIE